MLSIRKADPHELENIRTFYHQLTDACQRTHYDIGWKKDIYPSPELLKESLSAGELYIGLMNGRMASAMILNHECNDGYQDIPGRQHCLPPPLHSYMLSACIRNMPGSTSAAGW